MIELTMASLRYAVRISNEEASLRTPRTSQQQDLAADVPFPSMPTVKRIIQRRRDQLQNNDRRSNGASEVNRHSEELIKYRQTKVFDLMFLSRCILLSSMVIYYMRRGREIEMENISSFSASAILQIGDRQGRKKVRESRTRLEEKRIGRRYFILGGKRNYWLLGFMIEIKYLQTSK